MSVLTSLPFRCMAMSHTKAVSMGAYYNRLVCVCLFCCVRTYCSHFQVTEINKTIIDPDGIIYSFFSAVMNRGDQNGEWCQMKKQPRYVIFGGHYYYSVFFAVVVTYHCYCYLSTFDTIIVMIMTGHMERKDMFSFFLSTRFFSVDWQTKNYMHLFCETINIHISQEIPIFLVIGQYRHRIYFFSWERVYT